MYRQISKSRHSTLLNSWPPYLWPLLYVCAPAGRATTPLRRCLFKTAGRTQQSMWQQLISNPIWKMLRGSSHPCQAAFCRYVHTNRTHFPNHGHIGNLCTHWYSQATDIPPNIADLSPEENNTLRVFSWMNRINSLLGKAGTHACKSST